MDTTKPYYKKTIQYTFGNQNLNFLVSQELFSSQDIDLGTQRLLRTLLFEKIDSFDKALDLGCGYGPIGIVLKKICPQAKVHMVDRDALALSYARANAEANNVSDNLKIYGSLGYDSVADTDFDLIVSNIPAKVGEQVLTHILKDARHHVRKNGKVVIVVIDAIAEYIEQQLKSDDSIEITYHRSWPGHHVYHYRFKPESADLNTSIEPAFESGTYTRQQNQCTFKNVSFALTTTFHLREFDSVSYDTKLLLSHLGAVKGTAKSVLIFNPGQGYIPLAITYAFQGAQIVLVDRDLQALQISRENLIRNKCDAEKILLFHQVGIDVSKNEFDVIVGILPDKQNLEVYKMYIEQARAQLVSGGKLILCSSSTVITRVEELAAEDAQFRLIGREKKKGYSVISFHRS